MKTWRQIALPLLLLLAVFASGGWARACSQEAGQKETQKPKAESAKKPEKKKEKKADTGSERDVPEDSVRKVLSRVLRNYKQALESQSVAAVADWIDPQRFHDYRRFEEGVTTFLQSAGELRLFTREVNVQVEGDRAVMIVDAEMTFSPRDSNDPPQTRTAQITFDFQRTPNGWKITEINPRAFFLP